MNNSKMKKSAIYAGSSLLAVLCILAISLGWFNSLIAKITTPSIGADNSPVQVSTNLSELNNAIIDAAEAVSPTIVSISVVSEMDDNYQRFGGFEDFFDFFPRSPRDHNDEYDEGGKPKQFGSGSGVIITKDGYIVTNCHVVKNATEDGITVTTWDKKEYHAKLIGTDSLSDLAVIKIEASNLNVAHFGNADSIKPGMMVIAVGNPLGLNHSVTQGIVSAIGREHIGMRNNPYMIENFIQTDAAINPGNSGGGLFNLNGSLIGINTAIATTSGGFQGYGFAIPVDLVKVTVQDIIATGKVNRGYIGAQVNNLDDKFAKHLGLDKVAGVLVLGVNENSPAQKAGIQEADVILEVNGKPISTVADLRGNISRYRVGDKVTLTVWRDKKKITKTCILTAADENETLADAPGTQPNSDSDKNSTIKFDKLGFTIEPLSATQKEKFDTEYGVLISNVSRYSMAFDRNLRSGFVILKVDRTEIKSTGQLQKIIEGKKTGETILLNVRGMASANSHINTMIVLEIP